MLVPMQPVIDGFYPLNHLFVRISPLEDSGEEDSYHILARVGHGLGVMGTYPRFSSDVFTKDVDKYTTKSGTLYDLSKSVQEGTNGMISLLNDIKEEMYWRKCRVDIVQSIEL